VLDMVAALSPRATGPMHVRIADRIRDLVDAGALEPRTRLPAERTLAQSLGVSRMTLRQALDALEREGRLIRRPGSRGGLVVAPPRARVDIADVVGLSPQLLRTVDTVCSRVLVAATEPAQPAALAALHLADGALVHVVTRVRSADGVPVVLERSLFPAARFPDLLAHDLTGSLYAVLRDVWGAAPTRADHDLVPVLLDDDDARLLETTPARPVLRIERRAWSGETPVELSRDVFLPEHLRLTVSGRVGS